MIELSDFRDFLCLISHVILWAGLISHGAILSPEIHDIFSQIHLSSLSPATMPDRQSESQSKRDVMAQAQLLFCFPAFSFIFISRNFEFELSRLILISSSPIVL